MILIVITVIVIVMIIIIIMIIMPILITKIRILMTAVHVFVIVNNSSLMQYITVQFVGQQ